MAIKTRINPKTGETEYKARYYFITEGKKHDSETSWCATAEEATQEAKRLKVEKETSDKFGILQRRDKKLGVALQEYADELLADFERTRNATNKRRSQSVKTLLKKYTPNTVINTKVKDIGVPTFREWVNYVNNQKNLGGITTHSYIDDIKRFNLWLMANNYYLDDNLDLEIEIAIKRIRLKSRRYGNREDSGERNIITANELEKITGYIEKEGLEKFGNFYLYTMFYLLFYSGMRVEEMVALQWKFINLEPEKRYIDIKNAIPYIETKKDALRRIETEDYRTKNRTSTRQIPIFDFYYELLVDYKESYKYQYGLSDEEMKDCFVFPPIRNRNPHMYVDTTFIMEKLNKITAEVGIKKTDLQMFRHSCATFLIMPPPDGLGFTETKVKDYFGHEDITMLQTVYARLDAIQKAERMRDTFASVFKPAEDARKEVIKEMKMRIINRVRGDNPEAKESRKERVMGQILFVYKRTNRREYYYNSKDKWIIDEFKEKHKGISENMRFIEED